MSLLQSAPFEAGGWEGKWIGCKLFAPYSDIGSEEKVLFSLIYKAVNTSNIAIKYMSVKS